MDEDDGIMRLNREDIEAEYKKRINNGVIKKSETEKYNDIGCDKNIKQLQKEIDLIFKNKEYTAEKINLILNEKNDIRKLFLCLVSSYPKSMRRQNIVDKISIGCDKTLYNHLKKLIEIGVISEISILDIITKMGNGEEINNIEKTTLLDFRGWTDKMSKKGQDYFISKTHYWVISGLGMNTKIINRALNRERKFKGGFEDVK